VGPGVAEIREVFLEGLNQRSRTALVGDTFSSQPASRSTASGRAATSAIPFDSVVIPRPPANIVPFATPRSAHGAK
jgi:hypothetical protein